MANTLYRRSTINQLVRDCRLKKGISQNALGKMTGRTQRQISDMEQGLQEPTPHLLIKIFHALGEYEHIDLIHYMYKLHPLAGPPVDRELNENLYSALINLRKQMRDVDQIFELLEEKTLSLRPGRSSSIDQEYFKQIYDIRRSIDTLFYAAEREIGLDMQEVVNRWTAHAIEESVTMPSRREAVTA